jgi:hypothetical protein
MTVESLTDWERKQPNTSLEKEEMLRHKSFPTNYTNQYYELPPAGSVDTSATEQAVEGALDCQPGKNPPGPDKVSFVAIQLLWKSGN